MKTIGTAYITRRNEGTELLTIEVIMIKDEQGISAISLNPWFVGEGNGINEALVDLVHVVENDLQYRATSSIPVEISKAPEEYRNAFTIFRKKKHLRFIPIKTVDLNKVTRENSAIFRKPESSRIGEYERREALFV